MNDVDPIPLDIHNPVCPVAVIHSLAADSVRTTYKEVGLEPPDSVKPFLQENPEGRGYDWEGRVMKGLLGQPVDLIERWVTNGLPRGFFRAQVRAYLRERKARSGE